MTQRQQNYLDGKYDVWEARATADFDSYVGHILLAHIVTGYNDHDECVDIRCEPPARIRVCATPPSDLRHWCDKWLDPYWNVELVDLHPALTGIRSMWVFGPSYNADTGAVEPGTSWVREDTTLVQRFRDKVRARLGRAC